MYYHFRSDWIWDLRPWWDNPNSNLRQWWDNPNSTDLSNLSLSIRCNLVSYPRYTIGGEFYPSAWDTISVFLGFDRAVWYLIYLSSLLNITQRKVLFFLSLSSLLCLFSHSSSFFLSFVLFISLSFFHSFFLLFLHSIFLSFVFFFFLSFAASLSFIEFFFFVLSFNISTYYFLYSLH